MGGFRGEQKQASLGIRNGTGTLRHFSLFRNCSCSKAAAETGKLDT